jgi:predicted N-acetyltransferase YhbS
VSFSVRQASPADAPAIRALFQRVFGRQMSEAEWEWKYPGNPDGWLAFVACSEGRLVGHYGTWPMAALCKRNRRNIHALVDVMTEPAARHLGGRSNIFRAMAGAAFEELRARDVPFVFGFPSDRHLHVGERLVGYERNFAIEEISFPLTLRASGAPPSPLRERVGVRGPGGEVGACVIRDSVRVAWRLSARPDRAYTTVALPDESGWGALSLLGENALVMDYLASAPADESFPRLFDALYTEALRLRARRLIFWDPHGGPYRDVLLRIPGATVTPAGFSLGTVPFDRKVLEDFLPHVTVTPALYDDR